ncbi:sulfotransferase domain-containing protein [Shewanella sp.]|uniref:sulfotransferase domain-containing protein n=1 Tax=Shewanella sp. TaxID=50422 RepID=UPI004047EE70
MGLGLKNKFYLLQALVLNQCLWGARGSNSVVLSFEKSGRTWLRFLVSNAYFKRNHGSSVEHWEDLSIHTPGPYLWQPGKARKVFHSRDRVFFTHFSHIRLMSRQFSKVVFLRRDLLSIAKSKYFFDMYRYHRHFQKLSFLEYIEKHFDVSKYIELSLAYGEFVKNKDFMLCDYDDLLGSKNSLKNFLDFVIDDLTIEEFDFAVEYSHKENMRLIEERCFGPQTEGSAFVGIDRPEIDEIGAREILRTRINKPLEFLYV